MGKTRISKKKINYPTFQVLQISLISDIFERKDDGHLNGVMYAKFKKKKNGKYNIQWVTNNKRINIIKTKLKSVIMVITII